MRLKKKGSGTSIVITNPVIDGLIDGNNVLGTIVGNIEGLAEGVEVMKTEVALRLHWSL